MLFMNRLKHRLWQGGKISLMNTVNVRTNIRFFKTSQQLSPTIVVVYCVG